MKIRTGGRHSFPAAQSCVCRVCVCVLCPCVCVSYTVLSDVAVLGNSDTRGWNKQRRGAQPAPIYKYFVLLKDV